MSNQTFERDGYIFVGDLFWPTPSNNKTLNIQKLKKETAVDLYVKVSGDNVTNYGFAKKNIFNKKVKKIVSLGAFLLNFYEDDPIDIIIVVKLGEGEAGLLALKNGNVLPRGGDMIGDTETIRARVIHLIDTFGIGSIWTAGFGNYFYDDKEISTRLKSINPHFTIPSDETDENGTPLQSIWNYENTKKAIKKSILKPIPTIDITSKRFIMVITSIIALLIIGAILLVVTQTKDDVVVVPQRPAALPTSMTADNFINVCFKGADGFFGFPGGWVLNYFSCNLNQREARFMSDYSQPSELLAVLNNKNIVFSEGTGDKSSKQQATLKDKLIPNFNKISSQTPVQKRVEALQSLKQIPGINVQVNMPPNFISYENYNPKLGQKIKFTLTSKFSPIWFNKNQYFDGVALTDISAKYDTASGFYTWQINGEISN